MATEIVDSSTSRPLRTCEATRVAVTPTAIRQARRLRRRSPRATYSSTTPSPRVIAVAIAVAGVGMTWVRSWIRSRWPGDSALTMVSTANSQVRAATMPAVRRRDFSQRALAVTNSALSASMGLATGFPSERWTAVRTTTFAASLKRNGNRLVRQTCYKTRESTRLVDMTTHSKTLVALRHGGQLARDIGPLGCCSPRCAFRQPSRTYRAPRQLHISQYSVPSA